MDLIFGSGSVSKCHGSATLAKSHQKNNLFTWSLAIRWLSPCQEDQIWCSVSPDSESSFNSCKTIVCLYFILNIYLFSIVTYIGYLRLLFSFNLKLKKSLQPLKFVCTYMLASAGLTDKFSVIIWTSSIHNSTLYWDKQRKRTKKVSVSCKPNSEMKAVLQF